MEQVFVNINSLISEVFNDIIAIEQKTLKHGVFNDVSVTEVHTVDAIGMYEKKTMGEIAKILDITLGTLTVAINHLEKKGYVERFKLDEDKRIVRIGLSKKGRLLFRSHAKFHADMMKGAFSGMNLQEAGIFENALVSLHGYLKSAAHIDGAKRP